MTYSRVCTHIYIYRERDQCIVKMRTRATTIMIAMRRISEKCNISSDYNVSLAWTPIVCAMFAFVGSAWVHYVAECCGAGRVSCVLWYGQLPSLTGSEV